MRIEEIRIAETVAGRRASARLVWEETDRPPFDAYFESEEEAPGGLRADANAFLVAAFVPAARDGERRIRIEGQAACPLLRDGLSGVAALLRHWYGRGGAPEIEAEGGFRAPSPAGPAGLFLSGGSDSLHLLRHNRTLYPETHPRAFREAIHFLGMALFEEEPTERGKNLAARSLRSAREVAHASGLTLRAVRSNVARLSGNHMFWATHTQGAMLASVALAETVSSASLAASLDFRSLPPYGSHPLLDAGYGTAATTIRHFGIGFTRLEKLRLLASWPAALENMIVCHEAPIPAGQLNCGRCEKCVRTMLELQALSALDRATAFPARSVTAEMIEKVNPAAIRTERFWADLPDDLESMGRGDLARAVRAFLGRARRQRRWEDDRGWKGGLRRLDRRFLGGALLRARRATAPR